jgi:thiamine biosynthesis lipoprotein
LGTVCTVTLFEKGYGSIYNEIFSGAREIENLMSLNIPSSDVSRAKAAAGIAPVQVHNDVFKVIERALYFAEISGGAFDPSVGPLVSLWGINEDSPNVPSREEIDAVLSLVDWRNVELDADSQTVFLKHTGMALDLGAIAKGYAADRAAEIAKKAGVKRAIIDFGGNIVILGEREDKRPWRVGIQDPNGERGEYIGVVPVSQLTYGQVSVVTSGVYERFFEKDGKTYHHIFSPAHGYPADNELTSVTIIAPNSMDADALSTAVFVMGYEKGKALIDTMPEAEAVFVMRDNSVRGLP